MKKSLIALAVLAASGAAMAQSSVTLYGRLDASVASVKTETTGAAPLASITQTGVNESNLNSTFWGLKGTEDLGNGLKANFKLESRFSIDTGAIASANTLFEREANVGLSGGFGEVKLGRVPTSYDDLHGATNNVFNSNFATTTDVAKAGITSYTGTLSNSVKYLSPTMGGFSAAVQYSFGENKNLLSNEVVIPTPVANTNNLGDATDAISLHVKYAAGPLLVGYAYQEEKQAQTALTTAQDKIQYNLFAASYDFGVAKLVGAYTQTDNNTREDTGYQVGVSMPMGAFTLAAGYSKEESEGTGLATLDGSGYSLVGTYDLSKRTTLYVGYENTKVQSGTIGAISEAKRANFAAGVRHLF